MRKFVERVLVVVLSVFVVLPVFATEINSEGNTFAPYSIKAQFIGGVLFPHNKTYISPLVKGPMLGGWRLSGIQTVVSHGIIILISLVLDWLFKQ